jgi:hypothetical protein
MNVRGDNVYNYKQFFNINQLKENKDIWFPE